MSTNPELEAAVKRLRLADDALRFLSEIQAETMKEAAEALAEAREALEAVRAKRKILQVTGAAEGDILALTTDGEVWRLHTYKDLEIWSPVDPLPEEPPGASPDPISPSPGGTL
jgi:hypothetical protein